MEASPLPEDLLSMARLGEIMNLLLLEYLLCATGLCVSSYPHTVPWAGQCPHVTGLGTDHGL